MHALELVELAAVVAANGEILIRGPNSLSGQQVERYWVASKSRLDRWGMDLKHLSSARHDSSSRFDPSLAFTLFEEILSGEILVRIWGGVLAAYDRRVQRVEFEPLARSVYIGQMEARNRVLKLLATDRSIESHRIERINRFRASCERWTDLLLAQFSTVRGVSQYGHDLERVRDFALGAEDSGDAAAVRWALLLASLRRTFDRPGRKQSGNEDLNAEISQSVLGCFAPELFGDAGPLRTLWQTRLLINSHDAEVLVEHLLANPSAGTTPHLGRTRKFGRNG